MENPEFPLKTFEQYFEKVYEPAEDTFILLDAIEQDLDLIRDLRPSFCLEIGCGSGAVITSLAKALGFFNSAYFATDINRKALDCTVKCQEINLNDTQVVQLVQTDLSIGFGNRLNNLVDILIFNPPYVPTVDREIKNGIQAAWAGGENGRKVIDRFFQDTLQTTLSGVGYCYLVIIEQNNLEEIQHIAIDLGFECKKVLMRKCGIEKLSVLRFNRIKL